MAFFSGLLVCMAHRLLNQRLRTIIYANVETNLQLFNSGEQASHILTVGLGNSLSERWVEQVRLLVVPFIFCCLQNPNS